MARRLTGIARGQTHTVPIPPRALSAVQRISDPGMKASTSTEIQ